MVGMTPLPSTCPHLIFFAPLLSMLFVGGGLARSSFRDRKKVLSRRNTPHGTCQAKTNLRCLAWLPQSSKGKQSKAYYGKGTRRQHYKSHPFCKINPLLEEGLLKEAVTDDKLQGNNQLGTLPWINSQSQNNGPADLVAKAALQSTNQASNRPTRPTLQEASQPAWLQSTQQEIELTNLEYMLNYLNYLQTLLNGASSSASSGASQGLRNRRPATLPFT